jgi:hypothetical protein
MRDDVLQDVVGFRDYKINIEENLEIIRNNILLGPKYTPQTPLLIEKPKPNFAVRPGIVPDISDRILYQAIADLYIENFSAEPSVFSNVKNSVTNREVFRQGVNCWLDFQKAVAIGCSTSKYVVETDITAFFDHIHHDDLQLTLVDIGKEHFTTKEINVTNQLLKNLLTKWSSIIYHSRFGIPQINDASSFFAQVYLDKFDKWCDLQRFHYCRYVDDMRFFCNSEYEARSTLVEVIAKLRKMGLYVSAQKTRIIESAKLNAEILPDGEKLKEIDKQLISRNPDLMEAASSDLFTYFESLLSKPNQIDKGIFRFCLNRFKRIAVTGLKETNHPVAIEACLSRLISNPDSTDVFKDYLAIFRQDDSIQLRVIEFLESKFNVYPWQSMELLQLLVRMEISSKLKKRIARLANMFVRLNRNSGEVGQAIILLGKNGNYASRDLITNMYTARNDEHVNKAIILSVQELTTNVKKRFFDRVANDSPRLLGMTNYVKTFQKPQYHFYNPPNPYPLTMVEDSDDLYELGSEYFL